MKKLFIFLSTFSFFAFNPLNASNHQFLLDEELLDHGNVEVIKESPQREETIDLNNLNKAVSFSEEQETNIWEIEEWEINKNSVFNWKEISEKAYTDISAAYQLACAWKSAKKGLEKNPYKAIRGFLSITENFENTESKYFDKSTDKLNSIFNFYEEKHEKASLDHSDIKQTEEDFVCMGLLYYQWKANINKAEEFFQKPISLHMKRMESKVEETDDQKGWIAKSYLWLGIGMYYKDMFLKNLSEEFKNFTGIKDESSEKEATKICFEKAIEWENHYPTKEVTTRAFNFIGQLSQN